MQKKYAGPLLACVGSVVFAILPILVQRALARDGSPAG
jgi:hypothetical protein